MSDVKEPFVYFLGVKVPYDVTFIIVHHSVKILPLNVFRGRRQLKKVKLPEGLEEIGQRAFLNCVLLEHINYPSTLIKIGGGAFFACLSLREPTLPEGLKEIERYAFANCESLECINCPSTLNRIGNYKFTRCRSLKEVTLAGGVVTIRANAFCNCRPLEGITIPSKAFVVEVDSDDDADGNSDSYSEGHSEVFTCRLVSTDGGTFALTEAKQVIISPERLNYISSPDLLELQLENTITTIMNDRGRTREENIERVLALIKSRALFEVSTILELALWKNKMDETDDSNYGSRGECRVMCGADEIIPCVLSYV